MNKNSKLFLQTLFNKEEEICISPNKYAFKSVSQDVISDNFLIESQSSNRELKEISENDILLVSINPIKGDRGDRNVTAFRTFLVEIDEGDLYQQKKYIEDLKMPYSVCIFSGNKSLHYGITLSEDLPSEDMWRDINEWILAVVSKADQQTKNPSRGIRFPDNIRKDGKGLRQQLIDIKQRVDLELLFDWLDFWPELNPRLKKAISKKNIIPADAGRGIPWWIMEKLKDGVGSKGNRNTEWFKVAASLAQKGYDEEGITDALRFFFLPDYDFTFKEWGDIIKSAVKRVERGYFH